MFQNTRPFSYFWGTLMKPKRARHFETCRHMGFKSLGQHIVLNFLQPLVNQLSTGCPVTEGMCGYNITRWFRWPSGLIGYEMLQLVQGKSRDIYASAMLSRWRCCENIRIHCQLYGCKDCQIWPIWTAVPYVYSGLLHIIAIVLNHKSIEINIIEEQ